MEADTSIWHKSGHFYFALTRRENLQRSNGFLASANPNRQLDDIRGGLAQIVTSADLAPYFSTPHLAQQCEETGLGAHGIQLGVVDD